MTDTITTRRLTKGAPHQARRQARAEQYGPPRFFTWAEVATLMAAATEQDRAMILVTARTGLRLGEVLALR